MDVRPASPANACLVRSVRAVTSRRLSSRDCLSVVRVGGVLAGADHAPAETALRPTYQTKQRHFVGVSAWSIVRFAPSVGRLDDQETVPQTGAVSMP